MAVNSKVTLKDVFGTESPTNRQVDDKFSELGLSVSDFRGNLIDIATTYHVMGQSETSSDNGLTAKKKSMILLEQANL
ncbi:hypothetical protein [Vibrio owensii]|uniref:hypothetical protein n=1 Tax=Vibrio owensii TaxID=696485 RepID=UPI0018F18350|nr:hypothetical protein [Vibrio owensii]